MRYWFRDTVLSRSWKELEKTVSEIWKGLEGSVTDM